MYARRSSGRSPMGGFSGASVPRDLVILLGVLLFTFSLRFFASTAPFVTPLQLSTSVWSGGQVWRVLTYPFIGAGAPSIWFALELLVLFWFGRDVQAQLGRRQFWRFLVLATALTGAVAALVALASRGLPGLELGEPLVLIQGQRAILVVLAAAFARLYRDAVIYLMFVLPVPARWLIVFELVIGLLAFLASRDLGGFAGICAGVAAGWFGAAPGGVRRALREAWLRLQQRWIKLRLRLLRRRRGLRVIDGEGKGNGGGHHGGDGNVRRGPWVH